MLKINNIVIFIVCLISLTYDVYAQDRSCGNGILEPGEYCDPADAFDDSDDVYFDGITRCEDIPSTGVISWEGELSCWALGTEKACQLDIRNCQEVSIVLGGDCPTCESCDELEGGCNQDLCIDICGGGNGYCHYTGGQVGGSCDPCQKVDSCEDYEHPESCNFGGTGACNLQASEDWDGYLCDWVGGIDGECRANLDCRWNCEELYGECNGDGFRYKKSGAECELIVENSADAAGCAGGNPSNNFPNKVACGILEDNFPVFKGINLFFSVILLIGYYLISSRKNL